MTKKQLIESAVAKIVNKVINEADENFESGDALVAYDIIKVLQQLPAVNQRTNNKYLIDVRDQASMLRRDLMRYVEENSNYEFKSTSGSSWKMVKKR